MEWLKNLNEAIKYIEDNIEGKFDYNEVARIACCSLTRFQRMFSFVTDITVTDYVRSRKMSLAAEEIIKSDIKVIDLAMKYGYDSPDAFTRAFQAFHGIPPTTARKLGLATVFNPISFQIKINGGNINMGTKPIVRIEEHGKERMLSFFVNYVKPEETAGNLLRDWALLNLKDYEARRYIGCAPKGHHPEGESHNPDEEDGSHEYWFQMFLYGNEGENDTFLNAKVCDAPQGLYLVGDVALCEFNSNGGIDIGSSMEKASKAMFECLNHMDGYEFDFEQRRHLEELIFSKEWWERKDVGDDGLIGFKLWLPIKKS